MNLYDFSILILQHIYLIFLQQQPIQMKPKPVKKTEGKPKKDKSQAKRLKTFSSSQFSLWQQKNKALQASITDLTLLKNQAISNRRAVNNSALSQYANAKANTIKVPNKKKKKVTTVGNKTKVKTKQLEQQQQFQKAKYKQSNSQSQIVFSNDGTKRESAVSLKDVKYINSIHCHEIDTNLVLRVNIKKQYVRKVEAATKIQKVFRGFMTRKILMKYVQDEQQKLKSVIIANSSSQFDDIRQNQTHRTFIDKQGENLMSKLFQNKAIADINFNHTIRPRVQDFSEQSQNESGQKSKAVAKKINNDSSRMRQNVQNMKIDNWMKNQQSGEESEQQQEQQQEEEKYNNDEQSDQDESNMIYKRQNPIYSQQEISQYLQSSDEEYEEELDGYEPEIIFETNEEYIQSRKSSLQNKNQTINKLSNKGIADIALLLSNDEKIRKQLLKQNWKNDEQKHDIVENSIKENSTSRKRSKQLRRSFKQSIGSEQIEKDKQQQGTNNMQKNIDKKQLMNSNKQIQRKQEDVFDTIEIKENETLKKPKANTKQEFPQLLQAEISEKKQKGSNDWSIQKSPRREVKYLDEEDEFSNQSLNGSRSRVSVEKKEIMRLREQQCEKWDEVIKMVSQQIRKQSQSSTEMVNFMKNIMEFSQKNKDILASTRSVNSQSEAFTTPTSFEVQCSSKVKEQSRSLGLPVNQAVEQKIEQDPAFKFFKKKKPLKIDILDSNFLQQQRDALNLQKSDKKFVKSNKFGFQQVKDEKQQKIAKEIDQPNLALYSKRQYKKQENKQYEPQFEDNFQKSRTLKKFLSTNIQVQDEAISDMLKLREELLQKRESQELVKLNQQLRNNQLTQEGFLQRLSNLTKKFIEEKQTIDKAKLDIIKGYQAANNLVKEYFFDIRRMGIKLAVSKSQDNIKYKFSQPPLFPGDIQIDELTPKSTPKSSKRVPMKQIFAEHQISEEKGKVNIQHHQNSIESSEDSSIDFTEEELKRFRKAANYDLQFNDLNRNMTTLSDQFIKQQRKCYLDQSQGPVTSFCDSPDNIKENKMIIPQKQTYMLEEIKVPSARTPPHIQAIVENQINILMWEISCQLLLKPQISQRIIDKPSIIRPAHITVQERLQFLNILSQNLPGNDVLIRKLNQNITPLPSQILKCMRLDFSEEPEEEQEDENYEEVNRYQFVISQQACAKSVMLFKNNLDQIEQRRQIQEIKKNNEILQQFEMILGKTPLAEKVERFINQRGKFIKNKKQHTRQLRWEVINIQLHCIFDSWNEQIIQICSSRPGFSGIGLNQLTLSMINHNRKVPDQKCVPVVQGAKQKVVQIITDETDINAKILRQNFHEMCETDSAWIFYADQALSYALQLVYLVEEDIYTQFGKELRKIIVKNSLLP